MKKLAVLLMGLLFITGIRAQTNQRATGQTDIKQTQHSCYTMKDGKLMHCMGIKMEEQKTNVTLKEGTVITTQGEVTRATKDIAPVMLENGQCIDLTGTIGDYAKMHVPKTPDLVK